MLCQLVSTLIVGSLYVLWVDGKWIDREMLEMYLLDIMSKYVMREGGKVDELGMFGVWCEMVKGK